MNQFKNIDLSDRGWVTELLSTGSSRTCEHNFSCIYLWSSAYPRQISRIDNRLLLRTQYFTGLSYLFPSGSGPLAPAVEALREDAAEQGGSLKFICLTETEKAQLEMELPGQFLFQENRDSFDYLYPIDQLADLAGKKLHTKRNHIHRFCDQFSDWMFEPITSENAAECAEVEESWLRQQMTVNPGSESLLGEKDAILYALEHREELGILGGLIRADGRVLAFSMGSQTGPDCFDVHFEKAYSDIQGAYAVINREMARWIRKSFPEILFFNREDDMGLDGLRKAKLSYYPSQLITKYIAT